MLLRSIAIHLPSRRGEHLEHSKSVLFLVGSGSNVKEVQNKARPARLLGPRVFLYTPSRGSRIAPWSKSLEEAHLQARNPLRAFRGFVTIPLPASLNQATKTEELTLQGFGKGDEGSNVKVLTKASIH